MVSPVAGSERVFKTAWFSRAARKAHITDAELCEAMRRIKLGQADNLGGGVFEKRLGQNFYRAIVLTKGHRYGVFVYLFAKQDRPNIGVDELVAFRELADLYARKPDADIAKELNLSELVEICNG